MIAVQSLASSSNNPDAHTSRTSLTLSESERLDELDPLRHLLANHFDIANSNINSTCPDSDSDSDLILPQQRHTIQDEKYIVRYFRDPSLKPQSISKGKGKSKAISLSHEDSHSTEAEAHYHYDVILNCDQSKGCGGIIWPAAEVLGQYIASNQSLKKRWREKIDRKAKGDDDHDDKFQILELGSGTGLVGLLVAKIGFGKDVECWITDQIPMLDIMEKNLSLNSDLGSQGCKVAELNWGQPLPRNVPHKPDVLLLADCVYLEVAFQPLVDTMVELSTKETEILFCYQKRRKADKRFFLLLKKHFTFKDVQDDDPERTRIYRREGTQLLWVVKK